MDDHVSDSEEEEYLVPNPKIIPGPTDSISSFPVNPVDTTKDSISSSISVVPPTRPRPKPKWKGALPTAPTGDTSVIESFSGMSASERVKMRSRNASIIDSSSTPAARIPSSEIVEIMSSDDELALTKDQRGRSKTQSKGFAPTSSSSNQLIPNPRQAAPQRPALPPPFLYGSSPLPPSDPFPFSTASTRHQGEHEYGGESVPPIVTLAEASADYASSPPKEERPKPKSLKVTLKLPKPPPSDNVDELDAFEVQGSGEGTDAMMPPPILGASSTGLGSPLGVPPTEPPKKSRKKRGVDEGEKPSKKPRAKKAKTEESGQEKPKKKGKGKEKEKEVVYKSAEFINDDDDDEPVDGVPLQPMDVDVPAAGPSTLKPVSVISIPDSQADEELTPLNGEKQDRADEGDGGAIDGSAANKSKGKGAEKKTKKAKTATATVDKAKKRPAKKAKGKTVMSDEEDGTADADLMVVDSTAPSSNTIPPVQVLVLESEVGDDAKVENVKAGKIRKVKKTVITDSEGEEEDVRPTKKAKTKVIQSDSEGDDQFQNKPNENSPPRPSSQSQIENNVNVPQKRHLEETPKPSIASKYTIAPRTKSTPMSELIRRVNSRPGSPFPVVVSRRASFGGAVSASNPGTPTTSYSPYHKFSRSALSRIAPLHPNRRTPPPPLPPPPPKPKTKKEKEREERWEEEMIEAVGGWDDWKLLSEQEQKAARRAKWARELEGYED
ncbi:hypothetical protein C8R45DRAFT_962338 [Mycena sanguinolenta]|nr:hypothetical protein C8R45DRAFT_962338 [Mycena sanguinolenta]